MKLRYRISEYGAFITGKEVEGYQTLPPHTFAQLENFILTNRSKNTDALELMGLSARKGIGKVIAAKNYVGILTMRDGTTIEILPKIVSAVEDDDNGTKAKRLLTDMLKTLRDVPYKNLQTSSVNIEKMNIFEMFVRMFIDEVYFVVKRGLKCGYETVEENALFFRGKMNFSQQMRYNYAHKERSFVLYDTFHVNRPENRLIKATLLYLYRNSTSSKNRNDLKILLNAFAEVEISTDYKGDFAKYIPDRNMKDYSTVLRWCRVFLMGKSFTSFAGSEVALAMLFPMETLFESYVASLLKRKLGCTEFSVSIQDKSYYLFDEPDKRFQMQPDIVVKRKADGAVFVLDTKWKILGGNKANYGISQGDMYQMYAYQKKYNAENVTLLYPRTDKMPPDSRLVFRSQDEVVVQVQFVDLFSVQDSIGRIAEQLSLDGVTWKQSGAAANKKMTVSV